MKLKTEKANKKFVTIPIVCDELFSFSIMVILNIEYCAYFTESRDCLEQFSFECNTSYNIFNHQSVSLCHTFTH